MPVNLAPDFERLLQLRLVERLGFPAARVQVDFPPALAGAEVWVRIEQVGGTSDELNLYPVLDVDVFAKSRAAAKTAANAISAELLGYARTVNVGGRSYAIGRAESISDPVRRPYDDSSTVRIGATYELPLRR